MTKFNHSNTLTFTIKKIFYDQVDCGIKKYEWRSLRPKYKKLLSKKIKYIRLHYRTKRAIIFSIENIEIVRCPSFLKDSPISFTRKVYKIKIGEIVKRY